MLGIGCTLGVASSSAVFNSHLRKNLLKVIPAQYAYQVSQSPKFIRDGLPSSYLDATIHAYADSAKFVWYLMTIIGGLGKDETGF